MSALLTYTETRLKVRKFQNENMKLLHCPKYERNFLKISAWIFFFKFFRSFFSFWNFLTFTWIICIYLSLKILIYRDFFSLISMIIAGISWNWKQKKIQSYFRKYLAPLAIDEKRYFLSHCKWNMRPPNQFFLFVRMID